jgi:ATP dependent DNA ligase C terminal region.
VCEIAYTEWTEGEQLRQTTFLGWRDDKSPEEVVQEAWSPEETTVSFNSRWSAPVRSRVKKQRPGNPYLGFNYFGAALSRLALPQSCDIPFG